MLAANHAKKASARVPGPARNPAMVETQINQTSQTKKSLSAVIFLSDKSNFIAVRVMLQEFLILAEIPHGTGRRRQMDAASR